jgi:hypothetical protein
MPRLHSASRSLSEKNVRLLGRNTAPRKIALRSSGVTKCEHALVLAQAAERDWAVARAKKLLKSVSQS